MNDAIDTTHDLRPFIRRLMRGENLSRAEANLLLDSMLDDSATDAQIAAALTALVIKGETTDELAGLAERLRARAVRITSHHANFIDTAGTGASNAKTFNVSTAAVFVIAGAGLPVAKHGARAATSQSGSADVLSALGVNVNVAPEVSEKCLNEIGICFMFAPLYHNASARVAQVRRELGTRTSFNLLGPLANPARAPKQIIGVYDEKFVTPVAHALAALGTQRAWVLHGRDGLDEITLAAPTVVAEVARGAVESFEITPADFGLQQAGLDSLRDCCGDANVNARIIAEVLSGARKDTARDLVLMNAAAALMIGGIAGNLHDAMQLATESIDGGAARKKLDELIAMTTENLL